MADFARKNRGLELTFPPSGLDKHEPGNLSETVTLVHPVFGRLVRVGVRERIHSTIAFVNNGTKDVTDPTAERTVRIIEYADVEHDSATARHFGWVISNDNFAGTGTLVDGTRQHGAGSVYALGEVFALTRQIALGPGDRLRLRVFGAADAGMNVNVAFAFTDYTPADEALFI